MQMTEASLCTSFICTFLLFSYYCDFLFALYVLFCYNNLLYGLVGGEFVHRLHHETFDNCAKTSCAGFTLDCEICYRAECIFLKLELYTIEREELLILFRERVLGLSDDSDKRFLVEIIKSYDNGESSDEFGDNSVLHYVVSLNVFIYTASNLFLLSCFLIGKSNSLRAFSHLDNLLNAVEGAATYEEYVFCVYRYKFLIGMLSAALRRNVRYGALKNLQECLLYTFTGYVARDRAILTLSGYLIDLVNIDDSTFSLLYVKVGCLYKS